MNLFAGSSFTKAKPKHGFFTVTRLATQRYFFLPFYQKWWLEQTSNKICCTLFILYILQVLNIIIYLHNTSGLPKESEVSIVITSILLILLITLFQYVSSTEIVIPMLIMWVLSMIHSHIVATSTCNELKNPETSSRPGFRRRYLGKWTT